MREHKFVIVRTFINSIADCYAFSTPEYNKGNVLPKLIGGLKIADEIILKPHNGGVLEVELITVRTNGKNEYLTNERVYFDRGLVSAIEIFVEYDECRRQVKRQEDDEVAKLQSENALLRKVADAARVYLNGGYNETLDGLMLAVLELDKAKEGQDGKSI